jgi:bacillithiol biosynthesis cysteine-adding enzyme BshC
MRIVTTPIRHRIARPDPRRTAGVDAAVLASVVDAPGVDAIRARLGDPRALVVTTGQQPGLFLGPLYTLYKALSAAALATELERSWARPVVPVFWAANDDHDYAEAQWASWLDAGGEVKTGALPDRPGDAPLTPMSRLPLPGEITGLLDDFERDHPPGPDRDEALSRLRRFYRPGATLGAAYSGALAEWLAPLGIACFDSSHPAAKARMAPVLLEAVRQAGALDAALAARAQALEASGASATVPVGQGATLVFLEDGAGRDRLVTEGDGYITRRSGSRASLGDIETIAGTAPGRLSPNVLLRPVVESHLLPTVAYVAGPGELAYLAQCEPLYAALRVTPQAAVPRWSGILVEPRVDRVLDKFGATLEELLAPSNALEARVIRSQLPSGLLDAGARLRAAIDTEYATILSAAIGIDPTLERPVGAARQHAHSELADLEKKVQGHLRKREATELAQVARARAAVQPGGKPQERVIAGVSCIARFGTGLLARVRDEASSWYRTALAGGEAES